MLSPSNFLLFPPTKIDILFDKEVQEGVDGGEPRPYCRDLHAPVLLVLDEGLEILLRDLFEALGYALTESKEEHNRCEGAQEGLRLVVQTPLVVHVALEMLFVCEFHVRKLLKNAVSRGLW